jgi:excinuclease ABC subunit B
MTTMATDATRTEQAAFVGSDPEVASRPFELVSDFAPAGDQPRAIQELVDGLRAGQRFQTLMGATGTGKSFVIANVVAQLQRPALVMAPNKTLAAQLYNELKEFFPNNAIEYFVSYYDYYQPEAYIPSTDTFIEKDSAINDAIDRMRHAATRSLFERRDVIIVSSVSCIYGLGSAEAYLGMLLYLEAGGKASRQSILEKLVTIQYERNDIDFARGTFRVRGDVIEVFPAHEEDRAIRIELFGDEIEAIHEIDPLRGKRLRELERIAIYPNSHHVMPPERRHAAMTSIKNELRDQLEEFVATNRLIEAQRIDQRTQYDLEMMATAGFCKGIENYSRHLSGRNPGEPPPCLLDYFPKDWLLIADESHITVPQIGGMFRGDQARKDSLVGYGFRLPSARDNRPLKFHEWEDKIAQGIFVSATPGDWELEKTDGVVVEQIIRPTGLLDPVVEVRPAIDQVDDLYGEIRKVLDRKERVLVTTLTKRMSEDLSEYLQELGVKVRYLHSDVETIERMNILRDLRKGVFDVLIGINLLREGIDLPEVSLVGILDADKEGFLRSTRSLIQTIGRAARNANGKVIMYADRVTKSMQEAIDETDRRRAIQAAHNLEHGITPKTINKKIHDLESHIPEAPDAPAPDPAAGAPALVALPGQMTPDQVEAEVARLRDEMKEAARELRFEQAAKLRDQMKRLESLLLEMAG